MKKLMLVLVLAVAGACAAPTGTEPVADPTLDESPDQPTCRSGYAIANRNGEWVCEPAESQASSGR
jgi:hypothetical protein